MSSLSSKVSVIATGDELIHGDTLNTNGHAIAQLLTEEGFSLSYHLSCGDKEQEILRGIEFAALHADILIIIGGLGPTSDDRTRFALARFLNLTLTEKEEALFHIQSRIQRAQLTMNAGNRQQALFPTHATLLPNPYGTAMGCFFSIQNKQFILLPGPPRECLPMFKQHALPLLKPLPHSQKRMLKWRLFGLPESQIASQLDDALQSLPCKTAYRLDSPYIEFKVSCLDENVEEIKQIVHPIVEPHIIASVQEKASACLRTRLESLSSPVVIVDEVTGGVLQALIQSPKTYNQVYFHEHHKANVRFHLTGLEEYWMQKKSSTSKVCIKYQTKGEQGSETHEIPYYSELVVGYAVEWLSFRLIQLINQLH